MPGVKSLIKRHEVQTAVRKRTCKNSQQIIDPGEKCLVVYDGQCAIKTYSKTVAFKMIENAIKKLDELKQALL